MSVSKTIVLMSLVTTAVARAGDAAGPAPMNQPPVVVKVTSGGFHWLDAAAGAAAAIAVVLLVVGLALTVRHANGHYGKERGER